MYITTARHHLSHEHATPRSGTGEARGPLREIRLHVDDVLHQRHTLFPPWYYFQPSAIAKQRSSQNLRHYDSLTVYTSVSDNSARQTLAKVADLYPPATLLPTGKVDASQVLDAGERKRRLNSRDPALPSRPPARRPGHMSAKSASAVPTLSQINASAPYAPSPLGSPTTSTASARSSRRPSAASLRSVKSWLGRPATSSMATQQDGHLQQPQQQHQQPGNAADLLRQAMKHGAHRYVPLYLRCLLYLHQAQGQLHISFL